MNIYNWYHSNASAILYIHEHRLHYTYGAFPLLFVSPCWFPFVPLSNPLLLTWNPPSCDRIRPPRSQVACKLTSPVPTLSPNPPLSKFPEPQLPSASLRRPQGQFGVFCPEHSPPEVVAVCCGILNSSVIHLPDSANLPHLSSFSLSEVSVSISLSQASCLACSHSWSLVLSTFFLSLLCLASLWWGGLSLWDVPGTAASSFGPTIALSWTGFTSWPAPPPRGSRLIHRLNLEQLNLERPKLERLYPEWTEPRMDWTSNGPNPEWDWTPKRLNPEWDWTPNGPNPEWDGTPNGIEPRMDWTSNGPNLE